MSANKDARFNYTEVAKIFGFENTSGVRVAVAAGKFPVPCTLTKKNVAGLGLKLTFTKQQIIEEFKRRTNINKERKNCKDE